MAGTVFPLGGLRPSTNARPAHESTSKRPGRNDRNSPTRTTTATMFQLSCATQPIT